MSFLSVNNFWKYQNADVWKKSKTHPPWFKHYVHRDRDMDRLPLEARLLWVELLGAATRYSNVLEADLNWLYAETRVPPETIREHLPKLVQGGWIKETRSRRRSRNLSRQPLEESRDLDGDKDGEEDEDLPTDVGLERYSTKAVEESRNEAREVIAQEFGEESVVELYPSSNGITFEEPPLDLLEPVFEHADTDAA